MQNFQKWQVTEWRVWREAFGAFAPARSLPGMMLYNFLRGAKVMARDSMGSVMGSAIAEINTIFW